MFFINFVVTSLALSTIFLHILRNPALKENVSIQLEESAYRSSWNEFLIAINLDFVVFTSKSVKYFHRKWALPKSFFFVAAGNRFVIQSVYVIKILMLCGVGFIWVSSRSRALHSSHSIRTEICVRTDLNVIHNLFYGVLQRRLVILSENKIILNFKFSMALS